MLALSASLIACGGGRPAAGARPASRGAGHHRRRVEHRVPDHRSRRRGIPEGESRALASPSARREPAAASRSSAATKPTSRTRRGRSRPTEAEACAKAGIDFIELPVAYDGLAIVVNPKNTWVTVDDRRRSEEALGACRTGPGQALEPDPPRMAGPGDPPVRRRRRLGHVRLLHRSDRRQGRRRAAATTPRARTTTSSSRVSAAT